MQRDPMKAIKLLALFGQTQEGRAIIEHLVGLLVASHAEGYTYTTEQGDLTLTITRRG